MPPQTRSDLPPNRCIRCRRGRRKCGLYCRLCWDHARARMRDVAATPWRTWAVYASVPANFDRLLLTELRRMCDAGVSKPPDKETL